MSVEQQFPGKDRPRVSIVIVTYGSAGEICDCIDSLLKQSVPLEILLIDNASPDNTAEILARYAARFENIHSILNETNLGLGAANNCALGKCRGEYVLILNPDTLLRPDTLARMVKFLDQNPGVGILGPKNVYADGTPHRSFHRHWGFAQVFMWRLLPYRFVRSLHDRVSSYEFRDVLFVSGACLLIRRSIFEQIRGYDPEYFLTVEDACDLCIRAKQRGCRVVFLPEAEVLHHGGRSGVQAPFIVVWEGYRGSVYHFLKHKGVVHAFFVSLLLLISSGARSLLASLFGIGRVRYRGMAAIYGNVFKNLFFRNPIFSSGSRYDISLLQGRKTSESGTNEARKRAFRQQ